MAVGHSREQPTGHRKSGSSVPASRYALRHDAIHLDSFDHMATTAWSVLESCERAVHAGEPTHRTSDDKEFHFQRWVEQRIRAAGFDVPPTGRNTYPDFPVVDIAESYEVKGITVGSRESDFDCNSALPSGQHGGGTIFYVFGRYEEIGGQSSPRVQDIVIVHGSFLNAGGGYQADNKSMRVLGSYGDVLLRDRKMYVPYTPYRLLTGMRGHCTLVLPENWPDRPDGWVQVGTVERVEHDQVLVAYQADLPANTLTPTFEISPNGGKVHRFQIWRTPEGDDGSEVRWPKAQSVTSFST